MVGMYKPNVRVVCPRNGADIPLETYPQPGVSYDTTTEDVAAFTQEWYRITDFYAVPIDFRARLVHSPSGLVAS